MGTQLQLALDAISYDDAMNLVPRIQDQLDILELGTPFLLLNGLDALTRFHEAVPDLALLSDCKIMDGGGPMAELSLSRGATYVSVLAVAEDHVLIGAQQAAEAAGGDVVADLIACPNPVERGRELLELGVDHFCVHGGFGSDLSHTITVATQLRKAFPQCWLSVAGGVTQGSVGRLREFAPDALVVGGAITSAPDPSQAAARLREALDA
ncbi:MAG: orotidine 5'-phosphate decarboxylase / HUMPS family protein [Propionicimonas sp.]|nr:orotidine 5'-phosphate decarboxylase / HUMPS family protein [Propionicimonas sp.]